MKKFFIILLSCFSFCGNIFSQQKPNIVFILSDDLDDFLTPQYFSEVLPTIDSMKKSGINFENSFVPLSVCCPSRAATLSGKYGHITNVMRNGGFDGGREPFIDDEPYALPSVLYQNGYRTSMIGKYLNRFEKDGKKLPPLPYGWTDGVVHISKGLRPYQGYKYELIHWNEGKPLNDTVWQANTSESYQGEQPENYSTDVFTNEAIKFLNSTKENDQQPFFLFLNPTAPHFPLPAAPRHAEKTKQRWLNTEVPTQPNTYNDYGKMATAEETKKPLDKNLWMQKIWKKNVKQQHKGRKLYNFVAVKNNEVPKEIKSYRNAEWFNRVGSLYALNDMIDSVITWLKRNGEWENTLFIFSSDNGYQFGNHALYQKATPYEESIRVPMIITGGNALQVKQQTNIEQWVTNLDLMPTILDFADIGADTSLSGHSFKPLITQNAQSPIEWQNKVLLEYNGPGMVDKLMKRYRLLYYIMPSFTQDHPTHRAIRMHAVDNDNSSKVYKYMEFERYPKYQDLHRKIIAKDPKVLRKLEKGKKHFISKTEKAKAVDKELYCITDDPYEMDNLLYYQPEQYKLLAEKMKAEMEKMLKN
jgi:arylsulfatase A-like enzyme